MTVVHRLVTQVYMCAMSSQITGVVILTDLPPFFRAPPDHFDCFEWDPFFINLKFFSSKLF